MDVLVHRNRPIAPKMPVCAGMNLQRSKNVPDAKYFAILREIRLLLAECSAYHARTMTPAEKNIVKSLIAVAWADGKMEDTEASVVEGLLVGFDATEIESDELLAWAKTRRQLDKDVPVDDMSEEDRELLLSNAALLTHADGIVTAGEKAALAQLVKILGFSQDKANEIIVGANDGRLSLSSRSLS